jgi:ATP-binding cassette subfamily B protein
VHVAEELVFGAGKTTLIKLLAGFYEPNRGRITVGEHDLRELEPGAWRQRIAAVTQNFTRFELSLRENVLLGAVHRQEDHGALLDAIELANALDILEKLPNGLDTVLSPRYHGGVGLSGGQWQRIALARALYAMRQGASLVVLDEPTAQLDPRAEAAFHQEFFELTAGLTTVVISHRFSTVRRTDAIAVLEGGTISEHGTHDELMARSGTYAEMFRLQAARFDRVTG